MGFLAQPSGYSLFDWWHNFTMIIMCVVALCLLKLLSVASDKRKKRIEIGMFMSSVVSVTVVCINNSKLPLELCNMVTLVLIPGALFTRQRVFGDVLICATSLPCFLAVVTPGLNASSQWFHYIAYFIEHGINVFVAVYLLLIRRVTVDKKSIVNALLYFNAYVCFLFVFNYFASTNYMYLNEKPPYDTLLNYFSDWPWYIVESECILLVYSVMIYFCVTRYRSSHSSDALR